MSPLKGAKVLLIGGSGFIGSHTAEKLLEEDISEVVVFDKIINKNNLAKVLTSDKVRLVKGDILHQKLLDEEVSKADFVVLTAAIILRLAQGGLEELRKAFEVNFSGTYQVLESAAKNNVQKILFASSVYTYGNIDYCVPVTEDTAMNSFNLYGVGKITGEQLCKDFRVRTGLNYLALRYGTVYGPRQQRDGLMTGILLNVLDHLKKKKRIVVHGEPDEMHGFTYVEDIAQANVLALKSNTNEGVFNIVSPSSVTLEEVIKTVLKLLNSSIEVEYKPRQLKIRIPKQKRYSNKKAYDLLGFRADVDIEEGIKRTLEWQTKMYGATEEKR